jgi:hypothetical protein
MEEVETCFQSMPQYLSDDFDSPTMNQNTTTMNTCKSVSTNITKPIKSFETDEECIDWLVEHSRNIDGSFEYTTFLSTCPKIPKHWPNLTKYEFNQCILKCLKEISNPKYQLIIMTLEYWLNTNV